MRLFDSRVEPARRLAVALDRHRGNNPLVLAIARGAVEMGRVLADALGGELDVVLVRKLRSPESAEFAVGAIDETGWAYLAPYAAQYGADAAYLAEEKRVQLETLYDVSHNTCKAERHRVDGHERLLYVHARAPRAPSARGIRRFRRSTATSASR